jgi:hypothetical protein
MTRRPAATGSLLGSRGRPNERVVMVIVVLLAPAVLLGVLMLMYAVEWRLTDPDEARATDAGRPPRSSPAWGDAETVTVIDARDGLGR